MNVRGLLIILLLAAACSMSAVEPLTPANFDRLHNLMQPTAAETKWKQIPWMTRLWEARRKAAEVGKPILLWEMDGNPLGCT